MVKIISNFIIYSDPFQLRAHPAQCIYSLSKYYVHVVLFIQMFDIKAVFMHFQCKYAVFFNLVKVEKRKMYTPRNQRFERKIVDSKFDSHN